MNIYRVKFYADAENSYKTVLRANSIEDVQSVVIDKLDSVYGIFEVEGKHNRYFRPTRYTFIEYELMFANSMINFEDISNLDVELLKKVINNITNDDIFAIAFNDVNEECVSRFYNAMPENRIKNIKHSIENLWELKDSEIAEARQMIINTTTELNNNN